MKMSSELDKVIEIPADIWFPAGVTQGQYGLHPVKHLSSTRSITRTKAQLAAIRESLKHEVGRYMTMLHNVECLLEGTNDFKDF